MTRTTLARVIVSALVIALHSRATQPLPQSNTDGTVPPAIAPGNPPSSSKRLSGIEHVNLYNGTLNITIPISLLQIGGRGAAGYAMVYTLNTNAWTVREAGSPPSFAALPGTGDLLPVAFSPGLLAIRQASAVPEGCGVRVDAGPYVSRAVWIAPDGTESMLVDAKYDGQPQGSSSCPPQVVDRGRVFNATDGSNLTFVADADISDATSHGDIYRSGTLYFRNGTKYTINSSGNVTQIEDRNGNLVKITYNPSSGVLLSVVDPLNRTTTVAQSGMNYTITYPGFNGGTRTITITSELLQSALASQQSLKTSQCLFPELNGSSSTDYNPYVVSSITLPDNSSYSFQYNSYAEVARMALPTGGVYQYSFPEAKSCQANTGSGVIAVNGGIGYSIVRPMQERDEYANGSTLTGTTKYTTQSQSSGLDGNHPSREGTTVTAYSYDGTGTLLGTEAHNYYGDPTAFDSIPANPTDYPNWTDGLEFWNAIGGPNPPWLLQHSQVWDQRPCVSPESCWFSVNADSSPAHDPQMCQVDTTLDSGQTSGILYYFDQYNHQTQKFEYDYGVAPGIGASCPSASSSYTRQTTTSYNLASAYVAQGVHILDLVSGITVEDPKGNWVANSQFLYDTNTACPGNAPTPCAESGTIPGHDSAYGTGFTARGNLTESEQWWNANGSYTNYPHHLYAYDIAGNLTGHQNPNGYPTFYSYTDGLYFAPNVVTNAASQSVQIAYDTNTGKPISIVDVDGVETTYSYADPLDRLTEVHRAPGGGPNLDSYTTYSWETPAWMVSYQTMTSGWSIRRDDHYDGLGRPSEHDDFVDGTHYIATTQSYDPLGRVSQTTNPSQSGDGLGYGTSFEYDFLGRLTKTTTPDNAVATVTYSGGTATYKDQAGKQRETASDALGRLSWVVEDPGGLNYTTNYSYNAIDSLIQVTGSRTRSFGYDSRGEMVWSSNPESGLINYSYDPDGNLIYRGDARNIASYYHYDALDRISSKSYSDGTPGVSYVYDNNPAVPYSIGRLTQISSGVSIMNITAYDALGRITASNQVTGGQTYNFSYGYNLADELTTETYPSSRTVTFGYDQAGRPNTVSGTLGSASTNYITQTAYWPHGGVYYFTRGNNLWYAASFNSRLQQTESYEAIGNTNSSTQMLFVSCPNWGVNVNTWVYDICPHASATNDNGNMQSYAEYSGGPGYSQFFTFSQSLAYDGVNRLTSVSDTGGWSRNFGYDAAGNMWLTANVGVPLAGNTPTSNVYNANNQLSTQSYDAAGNMLSVNGNTAAYDAENRLNTVSESPGLGGGSETLSYDGIGQRVQKMISGGATTVYVHDAFGNVAAEYSPASTLSKDYIRFSGQIIATENTASSPCQTCYLSFDHLGNIRLVTDQNANIISRHDYLSFGEEIPGNIAGRNSQWDVPDGITQRFTGQTRDSETGEDFFNMRYFTAALGRFNSPDPANLGADTSNPQSWNGYAYVSGNPLNATDPTGGVRTPWGVYGDDGGSADYTIDGVDATPGMVQGLLAGGGAVQCPNNNCRLGSAAPFRCLGSVCGYMTTQYAATHPNEWDGVLYTNAEWAQFLKGQTDFAKLALAEALVDAIQATNPNAAVTVRDVYADLETAGTKGGNADFEYVGDQDLSFIPNSESGGAFSRYGSIPSIHLSGYDLSGPGPIPILHLDTANPLWGFGLGALLHLAVDVAFGNINPGVSMVHR